MANAIPDIGASSLGSSPNVGGALCRLDVYLDTSPTLLFLDLVIICASSCPERYSEAHVVAVVGRAKLRRAVRSRRFLQ